jgi:hypothetical protein
MADNSILLTNNTFYNLSLTGPTINIEGDFHNLGMKLVISRNSFSWIHAYTNTNAIHILKHYNYKYYIDSI